MRQYKFLINGKPIQVKVKDLSVSDAILEIDGQEITIAIDEVISGTPMPINPSVAPTASPARPASAAAPAKPPTASSPGNGAVTAPIPGAVLEVFVKEGDTVKAGQPLLKLEAMKMENEIRGTFDGTVVEIKVGPGDSVNQGQELILIGSSS